MEAKIEPLYGGLAKRVSCKSVGVRLVFASSTLRAVLNALPTDLCHPSQFR